ncbi:MAG TPA: CamS family sex pheromone protein [Niallia sp.]|nr:CamS family sex pheromone protein [Niallia sp.]
MKKQVIMIMGLILLLSACAPSFNKEEEVKTEDADNNTETAIIPNYKISDDYYKVVVPFKASKARGLVVNNLNTRYDIAEFETGLMRVAQNAFDPENYYFQEGQYIESSQISKWLEKKSGKNEGLNPSKESDPNYLAHILEHDYLVKTDDKSLKLGGVSIGLALNSVYSYKDKDGAIKKINIDTTKLEKEGKKLAEELIKRIRSVEGLEKVPVIISLFEQKDSSSVVPGNFLAYSKVGEGSTKLGDWEELNEKYVLFPDSKSEYKEDADAFSYLKLDIEEYFPNFNGVVGRAFYVNNKLQDLNIEIPIQFYGEAEAVGFTQFVAGKIMEYFPPNDQYSVQVSITSVYGPEALIVRDVEEDEPYIHIYQ